MNGMYMDKLEMLTQIEDLKAQAAAYEDLLIVGMAGKLTEMSVLEINPSSTKQLEIVLYGGAYTDKRDVPTGEVYKTGPKAGTPKTRKENFTYNVFSPIYPMSPMRYTTKEEDLKKLPISAFVDALLTYRGIVKELNTYFTGYIAAGREEGRYNVINTEFKHTITPTGRISSTKPNIQNLTGD
jgi:DNA polymerase I-like protein with 3'-5' exonuclease and polymerase domains